MNRRSRRQSGYSLMEIMVVIAIIGILSLVTVPAFMNFQRRNQVRSALRSFTSDLRSFRSLAISKNVYVRVQLTGPRAYTVFQSTDLGANWDPLLLGAIGTHRNERFLPETIEFTTITYNDSDNPPDAVKDVDFRPDGTAGDFVGSTATAGTITMRTDWKDILSTVIVDMSTTGQITTKETKAP